MVQSETRRALLDAAAAVLAERGVDGAATREIYKRAGVKAPTLYHHFGDKRGLMDAVVSDAFERYLAEKRRLRPTGDPVVDLRRGWDAHVAFARANPVVYQLMFPAGRGGQLRRRRRGRWGRGGGGVARLPGRDGCVRGFRRADGGRQPGLQR